MKKFGKLIFILCLVAVLAVTVAACNEKGEENNGGGGTLYGITMPSSDIYTIGGEVPESATEGTTITFTVTLNDPENSASSASRWSPPSMRPTTSPPITAPIPS